jgi:hypothetical protein
VLASLNEPNDKICEQKKRRRNIYFTDIVRHRFFFCNLFNNDVSNSDYIASNY